MGPLLIPFPSPFDLDTTTHFVKLMEEILTLPPLATTTPPTLHLIPNLRRSCRRRSCLRSVSTKAMTSFLCHQIRLLWRPNLKIDNILKPFSSETQTPTLRSIPSESRWNRPKENDDDYSLVPLLSRQCNLLPLYIDLLMVLFFLWL